MPFYPLFSTIYANTQHCTSFLLTSLEKYQTFPKKTLGGHVHAACQDCQRRGDLSNFGTLSHYHSHKSSNAHNQYQSSPFQFERQNWIVSDFDSNLLPTIKRPKKHQYLKEHLQIFMRSASCTFRREKEESTYPYTPYDLRKHQGYIFHQALL